MSSASLMANLLDKKTNRKIFRITLHIIFHMEHPGNIFKNSIFHLCPNVARFFKNSFIYSHNKKTVELEHDIIAVSLPPSFHK